MPYQEKRVSQINLMVVENLEAKEYSVFLTTDPMNVKTSKSLQEALINLIMSNKYTNRDTGGY